MQQGQRTLVMISPVPQSRLFLSFHQARLAQFEERQLPALALCVGNARTPTPA
jgi:hypothetical protein